MRHVWAALGWIFASAAAASEHAEKRGCVDDPLAPQTVSSLEALHSVAKAACPGQTILLEPGSYKGKVRFTQGVGGTAERPVVIAAAEGLGSVTLDGDGTDIVVKFSGSRHLVMRDLVVTGGGYHGVFFDRGASHIELVGNRIHDNHRKHPLDSHAEIKGSGGKGRPNDIVIRGNEIFHSYHPPGGNFQGIDCNFCDGFHIVGNRIRDIHRPTATPHSYYDRGACIQMKSASRATLIEGNRIERCHIGIVLGGEGLESPENIGGIVRDNEVLESADIGIAVVNAREATIRGNTVLGPGRSIYFGKDSRFPDTRNVAEVADNVLSSPPDGPDTDGVVFGDNAVVRRTP